jgi:hydroxymethylpyrimidine/phosphomethylpyrimidine kinase
MNRRPIALTIAGSDSSAGAGVQADLKTFAAHGVYGASVITAVTAQNTAAVRAIHLVPSEIVEEQIEAVFDDFDVAAVKIGMLGSAEIARAVARALARRARKFVVCDPVLAASSGGALAREGLVAALLDDLWPLVDLTTPNLGEAAALLGVAAATDEAAMREQGRALLALGARAVLMKGGHLEGDAVDWLVTAAGEHRFATARIISANTHGTGCTLSSAIAAQMVLGADIVAAVRLAKDFVAQAMLAARDVRLGSGAGPLMHLPLSPDIG